MEDTVTKDVERLSLKSRIALTISLIILTGFLISIIVAIIKAPPAPPDLLVVIQKGENYKIVYDRETKVMYSLTDGKYNTGELFPLYNPDGSLRLYENK